MRHGFQKIIFLNSNLGNLVIQWCFFFHQCFKLLTPWCGISPFLKQRQTPKEIFMILGKPATLSPFSELRENGWNWIGNAGRCGFCCFCKMPVMHKSCSAKNSYSPRLSKELNTQRSVIFCELKHRFINTCTAVYCPRQSSSEVGGGSTQTWLETWADPLNLSRKNRPDIW